MGGVGCSARAYCWTLWILKNRILDTNNFSSTLLKYKYNIMDDHAKAFENVNKAGGFV